MGAMLVGLESDINNLIALDTQEYMNYPVCNPPLSKSDRPQICTDIYNNILYDYRAKELDVLRKDRDAEQSSFGANLNDIQKETPVMTKKLEEVLPQIVVPTYDQQAAMLNPVGGNQYRTVNGKTIVTTQRRESTIKKQRRINPQITQITQSF
ncbi:MAG: hypothetical protein V1749_07175 [Candidatus Desantisbacteria bacterium]